MNYLRNVTTARRAELQTLPEGLYLISDVPTREGTQFDVVNYERRTGPMSLLGAVLRPMTARELPLGVHEAFIRQDGRGVVLQWMVEPGIEVRVTA